MGASTLEGGFRNTAHDAAHAFRAAMTAMARPGRIETLTGALPPAPLSVAAGTMVLTLFDPDTPVFLGVSLDQPALRDWIAFHTGAPFATADTCMFALGSWDDLTPLDAYPIGTPEYPDRSATLIVEVDALRAKGTGLTGPGIETRAELSLPGDTALLRNAARYPLGLDFFFTSEAQVAALPRSVQLEVPPCM